MKGTGQTQGKAFGYVIAAPAAALILVAGMTLYDYSNARFKGTQADARTAAYFAEQSGPFCVMEGVWHNWEEDETITLGCLQVRGDVREGSYSSATGTRATFDFAMTGTYDLDSDDSILVVGKPETENASNFPKRSTSMTPNIPRK